MPQIRRGQVWSVALDPTVGSEQAKMRPCVVVQRDAANNASPGTIVCPITDAKRSMGSVIRVKVPKGEGGLIKDSVVQCDQIRTVSHLRLRELKGELERETMSLISRGLKEILDI